jgi:hypothetical protein
MPGDLMQLSVETYAQHLLRENKGSQVMVKFKVKRALNPHLFLLEKTGTNHNSNPNHNPNSNPGCCLLCPLDPA